MAEHKVKYTRSVREPTPDLSWWAQCACGGNSGWQVSKQVCDDWWYRHEVQVQRALASLHRSNPSLQDQRNYYRRQAENLALPVKEREDWKRLADEIDHRLNDADPGKGQDPLF